MVVASKVIRTDAGEPLWGNSLGNCKGPPTPTPGLGERANDGGSGGKAGLSPVGIYIDLLG